MFMCASISFCCLAFALVLYCVVSWFVWCCVGGSQNVAGLIQSEAARAAGTVLSELRPHPVGLPLLDAAKAVLQRGESIVAALEFDRVSLTTAKGTAVADFIASDWNGALVLTDQRALIISCMNGLRHEVGMNTAPPPVGHQLDAAGKAVPLVDPHELPDKKTRHEVATLALRGLSVYPLVYDWKTRFTLLSLAAATSHRAVTAPVQSMPKWEQREGCCCGFWMWFGGPNGCNCIEECCPPPAPQFPVPGPRDWQYAGPAQFATSSDHVVELGHFLHALYDEPCCLRMFVPGRVALSDVFAFLSLVPAVFKAAPPVTVPVQPPVPVQPQHAAPANKS